VKQLLENTLASIIRFLPVSWASNIGAFFGRIEIYKVEKAQKPWVKRFYKNVEILCDARTFQQQHQCLVEFGCQIGRLYAEYTVLQKIYRKGYVQIKGEENLSGRSRPTLFIAPHMSNWEFVVKVFSELENPTCYLYEPRENAVRMRIANRARMAWGESISIIPTDTPFVMRELGRKISAGNNIYMMTDEEKSGYVWGPSLGRELPYGGNRWLASKLAVKYSMDVIPLYVDRTDNIYFTVHIGRKLSIPETGADNVKARLIADQIDTLFEQTILKKPQHWFFLSEFNFDKPAPEVNNS